jgi:hypothetical protein
MAYLFVLLPIGLYIPLFIYETYAAFKRLNSRGKKGGAYVHATWEVTHTFLILGLTNFIWLFSHDATRIAKATYWGLILAGAFFIVRAVLYLYLFFVTDQRGKHNTSADYLFALSHVSILGGIVYTLVRATIELSGSSPVINTAFIPWMWSGLVLLFALGAVPFITLYTTKD